MTDLPGESERDAELVGDLRIGRVELARRLELFDGPVVQALPGQVRAVQHARERQVGSEQCRALQSFHRVGITEQRDAVARGGEHVRILGMELQCLLEALVRDSVVAQLTLGDAQRAMHRGLVRKVGELFAQEVCGSRPIAVIGQRERTP
jgi:hypothetical protein